MLMSIENNVSVNVTVGTDEAKPVGSKETTDNSTAKIDNTDAKIEGGQDNEVNNG